MKILLLEDEAILHKNIKQFLTLKGHSVEGYTNGEALFDNAHLTDFDFFIFDINVPNIDGFELLRYIREKGIETPLILISAMIDIEDISKGFGLGCNDYLKKPFELQELDIRMNNIMKKFRKSEIVALPDNFAYNFERKEITEDGKSIDLSIKQREILYILMKNRGHVVSFGDISSHVYQDKGHELHTISSHIRDLRKLIGPSLIKNIRGIGYKIAE